MQVLESVLVESALQEKAEQKKNQTVEVLAPLLLLYYSRA